MINYNSMGIFNYRPPETKEEIQAVCDRAKRLLKQFKWQKIKKILRFFHVKK